MAIIPKSIRMIAATNRIPVNNSIIKTLRTSSYCWNFTRLQFTSHYSKVPRNNKRKIFIAISEYKVIISYHFVWNAKIVSPKQTAAVIPTAKKTSNWAYEEEIIPSKKLSASVNKAKKIKFIGNVRRTLSQHAIARN